MEPGSTMQVSTPFRFNLQHSIKTEIYSPSLSSSFLLIPRPSKVRWGIEWGIGTLKADGIRRPARALTAASVRSTKTPGKYFDGHGLFLKVTEAGARHWVQRIVIRGKRCEIGLGSAELVSLADARAAALKNREMARSGGDPLEARRAENLILSFEAASRKVHEALKPSWRNEKHGADFIRSLELYAFPVIGFRKIGEITSADVLAILEPIWTSKPETARRVKQRVGQVLKWAIAKGIRTDNPAENVAEALARHGPRTASHRKALPYSEVTRCIAAVRSSRALEATKLAIEFLVLTAARSGEVRFAVWDEIDLDAGVWTVPSSRMKMKREHRVPLSPRALAVLERAEALRDQSGLLFPSSKGKALSDMTLSKLIKELGFTADIHGMRTSFRTFAQEQTEFSFEVCEAALAHNVGDSASRAYARSDLFEKRRQLMNAWSLFLEGKG